VEAASTAVGERIGSGFLPHALIVQVMEGAIDDLRQSPGAAAIYTAAGLPQLRQASWRWVR
jgi:hypothetical protein